ncbi:MAG: hypothetical protein J6D19_03910 [Clostridia bacterium]|nr:hypothetical protein [Clostridia bacterium]
MKKLLSVLLLALLLTGCGNFQQNYNSHSDETTLQENLNKVEDTTIPPQTTVEPTIDFTVVRYGDIIKTNFIEMSINKVSTAQELKPSDTSGAYSYYPDEENETYFFLTGNIKNIGTDSYSVEEMNVQFTFDGKYNYQGFIAADDGGHNFYGDRVKPFGTVKYYMYASIPDELIRSYSTCTIKFAFHENCDYDYSTDFSKYEYLYELTVSK